MIGRDVVDKSVAGLGTNEHDGHVFDKSAVSVVFVRWSLTIMRCRERSYSIGLVVVPLVIGGDLVRGLGGTRSAR